MIDEIINQWYKYFINAMEKGAGIDSGWVTMDLETLNGIAGGFASIAGNIALLLTTVYFLLEINMRLVTDGSGTPIRTWVGSVLKFGIAAYLVGNGGSLTMNFLALANSLTEKANSISFATPALSVSGAFGILGDTLKDSLDGGPGFFCKIFVLMFMAVGLGATWVCGIVWIYKAISFRIEFAFRVGLYPFALADAYQGNSSSAVRFLKSIIGMGLYGVAFIVIPKIGMGIMAQMLTKMFDNLTAVDLAVASASPVIMIVIVVKGLFCALAVPAAEIGCLGICKQAIKEYLA